MRKILCKSCGARFPLIVRVKGTSCSEPLCYRCAQLIQLTIKRVQLQRLDRVKVSAQ